MKIQYTKPFLKQLKKHQNPSFLKRVNKVVDDVTEAKTIQEISNLVPMVGHKFYYRIRLGNFRIGVKVTTTAVTFLCIYPRGEIYKRFP